MTNVTSFPSEMQGPPLIYTLQVMEGEKDASSKEGLNH